MSKLKHPLILKTVHLKKNMFLEIKPLLRDSTCVIKIRVWNRNCHSSISFQFSRDSFIRHIYLANILQLVQANFASVEDSIQVVRKSCYEWSFDEEPVNIRLTEGNTMLQLSQFLNIAQMDGIIEKIFFKNEVLRSKDTLPCMLKHSSYKTHRPCFGRYHL